MREAAHVFFEAIVRMLDKEFAVLLPTVIVLIFSSMEAVDGLLERSDNQLANRGSSVCRCVGRSVALSDRLSVCLSLCLCFVLSLCPVDRCGLCIHLHCFAERSTVSLSGGFGDDDDDEEEAEDDEQDELRIENGGDEEFEKVHLRCVC